MPARVTFRTRAYAGPAGARSIVEYRWNGRQVIAQLTEGVQRALQRAADDATSYWREVVWTEDQHPYMKGTERDAGRFITFVGAGRVRLVAYVDLDADYPLYEEFGTRYREGHFPMRRTVDYIAPRIREYVSEELRAETGAA